MANNYSVSSFTLMSKPGVDPTVGKIAKVILQTSCLDYKDGDSLLVVDIEQHGSLSSDIIFEAIAESEGLELSTLPLVKDLLSALLSKGAIKPVTHYKLSEYLGSLSHTEDSYDWLSLGDLLACLFDEDGCNLTSVYEEYGYYCDKSRHGNFGGGSGVWTRDFITSVNSTSHYDIAYRLSHEQFTLETLVAYFETEVNQLLSGIKDPNDRSLVKEQLIKTLSKSE